MKKNKSSGKSSFTKVSVFMEKVWLFIAIATLIVVFYFFIVEGVNRQTLSYLVFPALAGAMYAFRTTFRKRFESNEDSEK
ncbi:MAG: hypothetical protein MK086_11635 [Flavobacteriales bacterium]|nr:hypothetical protein [Flavobacteriales bacterium]